MVKPDHIEVLRWAASPGGGGGLCGPTGGTDITEALTMAVEEIERLRARIAELVPF